MENPPPPLLGHRAFLLNASAADGLGEDGHPCRDGLMPPVPLPRRMFAASAMDFPAPLVVGAPARLRLTIANVRHTGGQSGKLMFVEVDRRLVEVERISEHQTVVYRGLGDATHVPRDRPFFAMQPVVLAKAERAGAVHASLLRGNRHDRPRRTDQGVRR